MEVQKKMGTVFREKREEMNLSLKEVENVTSIRMTYLQAIEEGRAQRVLSPVYVLGFLRQYATFLGLDPENLSKQYPESFRLVSEKQDFAYGIGTLESRNSPQGGGRLLPNIGWTLAFGLLAIGAWYFGKMIGAF